MTMASIVYFRQFYIVRLDFDYQKKRRPQKHELEFYVDFDSRWLDQTKTTTAHTLHLSGVATS
jgi:hypothetical protein